MVDLLIPAICSNHTSNCTSRWKKGATGRERAEKAAPSRERERGQRAGLCMGKGQQPYKGGSATIQA